MKRKQSASSSTYGKKRRSKVGNPVQAPLEGASDTTPVVKAVSPFDHVLLEHSATFGGHRLKLRVTTPDATRPDRVAVHVCYGNGKAAVTVTADGSQNNVCETTEKGDCSAVLPYRKRGNAMEYPESSSSTTEGRSPVTQSAPVGEASCPAEILTKIFSFLSWKQQMGVRRVSRRWRAVADACLSHRQKLYIGLWSFPRVLDNDMLERLLRSMPSLTDVIIRWSLAKRMLDIDYLTQHCHRLQAVDLTRFCLDVWSLEQLCISCPRLEAVTLPKTCGDAHVSVLLRHLPQLRVLNLTNSKEVTGKNFSQLPASLEVLVLSGCENVKSASLKQLAHCVRLRELDVSGLGELEEDVTPLLAALGQLESLRASETELPLSALRRLPCPAKLRRLKVQQEVSQDNWAGFSDVLAGCTQLEELTVHGSDMPVGPWSHQVASCSLLRELKLDGFYEVIEEDLIVMLAGCPLLERLEVKYFYGEDPTWTRHLGRCKNLRVLNVWFGAIRDKDVLGASLARLPRLEYLSMADVGSAWQPMELFLPPTGLPTLVQLNAGGCDGLNSNSLRRLSRLLPRLRSLDIRECENITEDGLWSYLPRFQQLEVLNLSRVPAVTDGTLDRLQCCPRLQKLFLGRISGNVTYDGVRRLVMGCPLLDYLWIYAWGSTAQETTDKLDLLITMLDVDRDFTLCVREDILEKLPRLPPGHLLVVDASLVPRWRNF